MRFSLDFGIMKVLLKAATWQKKKKGGKLK